MPATCRMWASPTSSRSPLRRDTAKPTRRWITRNYGVGELLEQDMAAGVGRGLSTLKNIENRNAP
jgi:hypothetical protein